MPWNWSFIMVRPLLALAAIVTLTAPAALLSKAVSPADRTAIAAAVAAPSRTAANRARDQYRHPAETLAFFGVKPGDTVVELWPGGGWYTEILAPLITPRGTLIVAVPGAKQADSAAKRIAADPATYGKIKIATFPASPGTTPVAAGSADVVLTFRNVHNWRFGGADKAQVAFIEIFAMLKPGGVLGIEDHRLPENMDSAREADSGYLKRSTIMAFAKKAGFQFAGESPINANPRDTHDYAKGVWTLPPTFEEGDKDRARYAAIGESDRLTMKFIKPRR
jgi:predicted methyltransferase